MWNKNKELNPAARPMATLQDLTQPQFILKWTPSERLKADAQQYQGV